MELVLPVVGSLVLGALGAVIALLLRSYRRKKSLPLPPFSSASMFENMSASSKQKTLYQHERNRKLFNEIGPNDFGRTPHGAVFQSRVPVFAPFIVVSDYVLARKVLAGDSSEGLPEGEKAALNNVLNFLDRKEYNILTHQTSSSDREKARKSIAQAFSTTNLMKTWPHIKDILSKQFVKFRSAAQSNEVVDMKTTAIHFFLRTLSRGAFGVEYTTDGTENENNINGLEYLEAVEIAARESAREMVNPFRTYMFWAEGVKQNKVAVKTLLQITQKLIRLHRAKQAKLEADGVKNKPFSIIDHVTQHSYSREMSRLADLSVLSFAGMDSSTFTFCFLLMELCKNPHAKSKLQAELAAFMPARCEDAKGGGVSPVGVDTAERSEKELLSAIANCEYLNWCIKETLRLYPTLARGNRRDLIQDIEYCGMLLPKGSMVILNHYVIGRERWIEQPDVYLPERWSDSNPQLPQLKEMLMPFSLGKRACIGQNMAMFQLRIVAAHFLHYFDFELAAEPTFEQFITVKPDKLLMRVIERHF